MAGFLLSTGALAGLSYVAKEVTDPPDYGKPPGTKEKNEARRKALLAERNRMGRQGTILTGGQGVTVDPTTLGRGTMLGG